VISVAEANTFKPHVATYAKAAELCSVAMGEVLFVANHEFDCVGAKARACAVFIDRRRPFAAWPHQLDVIVASMTKLVAAEPAGPLGSTIATATPWSRARPTSLAAASEAESRLKPRSPKDHAAARGLDTCCRLQHAFIPAEDASRLTVLLRYFSRKAKTFSSV